MDIEQIREKLAGNGQEHLLKYYDNMAQDEQLQLIEQIKAIDFDVVRKGIRNKKESVRGRIEPIKVMTIDEINSSKEKYIEIGEKTIREGRVAAVLLAGGMGTRLGADGPKGKCDIGLTKPVYIFQRLFENLLDTVRRTDTYIHLFIMTSEKNNDETIEFIRSKNYFGYAQNYVHFFKQEMAPATDYSGRVYLESKSRIATSPNGNGGFYTSMIRSGMYDIVRQNGIEWLNVFAVDNVLQRIADPGFVGATILSGNACGSKVIRKANREEKVGVLCMEDNRPSIVEYYELTEEMKDAVDENGNLVYNYGVILNYLFKVQELDEIVSNSLPLHVVEKKIPYIDDNGIYIEPKEPNGYKFETLILDMIKLIGNCLGYEVERNYEFAPIKNKTGADSIESARKLLELNGIKL